MAARSDPISAPKASLLEAFKARLIEAGASGETRNIGPARGDEIGRANG